MVDETSTGEPEGGDTTPPDSPEPGPVPATSLITNPPDPSTPKLNLFEKLARMRWVLLAGCVKLLFIGLSLVVCVQVLGSTPHKDIFIQWTTTPLTVIVSAFLVLAVALRELLGQVRGNLALQVRGWLNFLIPLLLLIFVSILLNKFNLVTSNS